MVGLMDDESQKAFDQWLRDNDLHKGEPWVIKAMSMAWEGALEHKSSPRPVVKVIYDPELPETD